MKRTESEYARKYIALGSSEVEETILLFAAGEVGARDIELCKNSAITSCGKQVLDKDFYSLPCA